jgi:predicted enzyme related to lactoylglutathione lyase
MRNHQVTSLAAYPTNYNEMQFKTASLNIFNKEKKHMLNLNSIMIGTKQPQALAAFYEKVLGKPAEMAEPEMGFYGWQVGSTFFSVMDHSEMGGSTKDPGRVMFNFETPNVKEEFARIKELGGVVIREPYEMGGGWIATLADLDGNYFQLMTPMGPENA